MSNNNLICIAKITGTHGVHGLLKVKSFTENVETLLQAKNLYDKTGNKTFKLNDIKSHKDGFLCKIDGIENPEDGVLLRGQELYIDRDTLPEPDEDEFYYVDLIGLDAKLVNGDIAGKILAVQNHGAGDMLEIKPDGAKSFFVPFTEQNVPEVKMKDKYVTIVPLSYAANDDDK